MEFEVLVTEEEKISLRHLRSPVAGARGAAAPIDRDEFEGDALSFQAFP